MAIEDKVVNVGVEADESRHSTPNYLEEVARILQELGTRGTTESLTRILEFANQELSLPGNDHAYNKKLMGTREFKRVLVEGEFLPKELLYNIFARLSIPEIIRVGCLSKEWMPPVYDLQQECDKAYPKIFALVSRNQEINSFWVRLFDIKLYRWHAFEIPCGLSMLKVQYENCCRCRWFMAGNITAASEDGGLVCFVSTFKAPTKKYPSQRYFSLTATNPLTKTWKELPLVRRMSIVRMVKITTDAQTKSYKVLLVGVDSAGLRAQVYDPTVSTVKWTRANKSPHCMIFEFGYHLGDFRCSPKRDKPTVYDSAGGQLVDLFEGCPEKTLRYVRASHAKNFSLQKDRAFVLKRDPFGPENDGNECRYYISEYQIEQLQPFTWIQVDSHRCKPFERPPLAPYKLTLHACQGFLMVFADLSDRGPYSNVIGWLYDLTTSEWRDLPKLPQGPLHPFDDLMCRIHWDVHP